MWLASSAKHLIITASSPGVTSTVYLSGSLPVWIASSPDSRSWTFHQMQERNAVDRMTSGYHTSANAMAGSCFPFPIRVSLLSLYDFHQYSRNCREMHYAIFWGTYDFICIPSHDIGFSIGSLRDTACPEEHFRKNLRQEDAITIAATLKSMEQELE